MTSKISVLKEQINNYFHTTYLAKYPLEIHDMLIHLFNDGKRIRPILFTAFNDIETVDIDETTRNVNVNIWLQYAIDIELIHCLSLVMDDLPEMDDELERRGKPCFHIIYGIQKTNFFLYYMFSKLSSNITNFLELHDNTKQNQSVRDNINTQLLDDASFLIHHILNNLIDGQYIDISSGKLLSRNLDGMIDSNTDIVEKLILSLWQDIDTSNCDTIIRNHIILNIKKTGSLFALPIITGFLFQLYKKNLPYTGVEVILDEFYFPTTDRYNDVNELDNDNMLNLIMTWSLLIGFLFQTSDDFLDMASDAARAKPNICILIGADNSKKLLTTCLATSRVMFDYIIKNTQQIWPDVRIDSSSISEIIDLIETRMQ